MAAILDGGRGHRTQFWKKSFQQTKYESPLGVTVANYQLEGPNSNSEGYRPWTTANLNTCSH